MPNSATEILESVWSFNASGEKVHPYKGQKGTKRGLYSVNFTNDTKKFRGMTEAELVQAIVNGQFRERGTIRMLPAGATADAERNAFAPRFFQGRGIKSF